MQARKSWILAVLAWCLAASGAPAAELRTRTVAQSPDGLRLELDVELPDPVRSEVVASGQNFTQFRFAAMRPEGSPGAPELALGTELVALPPGGSATLRVLQADIEDLGPQRVAPRPFPIAEPGPAIGTKPGLELLREDLRYDPAAYVADGTRDEPARLGAAAMLRHQRVVPLELRPLLYDPVTGRARLVRRLRLQIDLHPGALADDGGDAGAARLATSASWERIYAASLVNAATAASWRRAPRRAVQVGGALKSGLLRPGLLGEDEWRLRVRQTGPTRVSAAALRAAGFPDGTPVGQVRCYLKRFAAARPLDPDILEIPIQIVDVDADGSLDPEDSFLFYAEDPRDDTTSEDRFARYSAENVYWVSVASGGTPARMPVRPRLTGTANGPSAFRQQLVYEEDHAINPFYYGSNQELVDSAGLYYWTDRLPVARITVPVPARAPGESLGVCVVTQEDMNQRAFDLYVRTGSRDSVYLATNFGTIPGALQSPPVQTTCGVAADAQIDPGNVRVILRPRVVSGLTPYVDRIRLDYRAVYAAVGNRVRCTSGGASGATSFPIGGFTDPNLRAFDITDPKAPATFDLSGAYASGTLTLTDDVPAASQHVYLVVADATIPSIAAERDQSRDDFDLLQELATQPVGTYDCLVVVHDDFAAEPTLAQWMAFRSAQGHRIRKVRTSDIYDAFRGGLQHYEAIHRLCQLAFDNWGIQFVCLVGDGSEDPVRMFGDSGPNYVPARVRYFLVQGSGGGGNDYRNDMNDKYYAQVAGGPLDTYPDLLLGRLPVGSPEQLAAVLQKTMLYETPQPNDDGAWRKRVVMFSDDEWVKRSGVGGIPGNAHLRSCPEVGFQTSVERASDTVDGAFPGDLHAVRFMLRDYSDKLYPAVAQHRPVPMDSTCYFAAIDNGQAHGTSSFEQSFYFGIGPGQVGEALIDSVGEGVLFFALQSHANRVIVADEQAMSVIERPFAPAFHNDGKPFVFFGFGCHLNEYAIIGEQGDHITEGDALGEELVVTPSRGAVASYASTGFEYLGDNNVFHESMWNVIFNKRWSVAVGGAAVNSDTLAARWLLSDLIEIAEIRDGDPDIIARYVLLGDPMLRLDAGVPRVSVDRVDNGFLQTDNRLVIRDSSRPLGLQITMRDEQGIDSLWVVQRYRGGATVPVDSVVVTANIDPATQIAAKRSYTVAFEIDVGQCDFDVVVGARDLAGRTSEFVGHVLFDQRLLANGLPVQSGDRVDPRTAFRFEIKGCTPIPPPLPLAVFVDGAPLPPEDLVLRPDSVNVNWNADFTLDLANGPHVLRFDYSGLELATYSVEVGGFGMSEVLVFPNPMRKQHDVMRLYFHLGEPIAGGSLRVLTLNGRTVQKQDLATPGVVQSDVDVPPGSIGSGVGQDSSHWNYVELFRDGRDLEGDAIANGVYLVELVIRGTSGQQQRKRDKLVVMR